MRNEDKSVQAEGTGGEGSLQIKGNVVCWVFTCYEFIFTIYLFSHFMGFGREKKLGQIS